MASVGTALRDAARAVSPGRRRYQRLLASCALDPTTLALPLAEPGPNDLIICGCPRSGTALLAAALHQPPTMVSVMEPWDGLKLAPERLFSSLRTELDGGQLVRGRLDLDALRIDGSVTWQPDGDRSYTVETTADTLVAVKWPTFWQYLPHLHTTRFLVCVRHPAEVLASFVTQPGRLADGLEYDVAFNRDLNRELGQIAALDERRLALYDRVNHTVLEHRHRANVHLVHYEDWQNDTPQVLDRVSDFLGRDLTRSQAVIESPNQSVDQADRAAIASRSTTARALGY